MSKFHEEHGGGLETDYRLGIVLPVRLILSFKGMTLSLRKTADSLLYAKDGINNTRVKRALAKWNKK